MVAAAEQAGDRLHLVPVVCVLLSISFHVLLTQNCGIVVFIVLCALLGRDHEHAVSESLGLCL